MTNKINIKICNIIDNINKLKSELDSIICKSYPMGLDMLPETNILLTNVFYNTYNYDYNKDIYNHECNKKRCKGVINEIQKVYINSNLESI